MGRSRSRAPLWGTVWSKDSSFQDGMLMPGAYCTVTFDASHEAFQCYARCLWRRRAQL